MINNRRDKIPGNFRLFLSGFAFKCHRLVWTGRYTVTASNTSTSVQKNLFFSHLNHIHLAAVDAGPASITCIFLQGGTEWRGNKCRRVITSFDSYQNVAAASAAHAAECGFFIFISALRLFSIGIVLICGFFQADGNKVVKYSCISLINSRSSRLTCHSQTA